MNTSSQSLPPLPTLADLGHDLLQTTAQQRMITLARPFLCVCLYIIFGSLGWWPLAVLAVMLLFVAIVQSAHDLAHQVLGLPRWFNDWLLCLVGLLVLESGHAYQVTHLQHHRRFPDDDDPEGDPAHVSFWRAVLEGPTFLYRLWWWAWQNAPQMRSWLLGEAAWFLLMVGLSVVYWQQIPALTVYTVLVIVGSWTYPLMTVYLPHNANGESALFQTYTLRGRFVPALFLELTYHLEHHLYPSVPSHHYHDLAERLEPYLKQAGVQPVRVL